MRRYFETNANVATTYQNIRDAAKARFTGRVIAINDSILKKIDLESVT